jgi:hypothetical protein
VFLPLAEIEPKRQTGNFKTLYDNNSAVTFRVPTKGPNIFGDPERVNIIWWIWLLRNYNDNFFSAAIQMDYSPRMGFTLQINHHACLKTS